MAPAAIVPIMIAATVASTAVSAMGAMAQGQAQQAAAKYNATLALQQGDAEAAKKEQENRRKLAEARAAYGAAGVEMQGTPLEVMQDLAVQGELDRQTILYNARQQAVQSTFAGQEAMAEAKAKTTGTILTGIGSAAGTAYNAYGGGSAAGSSAFTQGIAYPSATQTAHY